VPHAYIHVTCNYSIGGMKSVFWSEKDLVYLSTD